MKSFGRFRRSKVKDWRRENDIGGLEEEKNDHNIDCFFFCLFVAVFFLGQVLLKDFNMASKHGCRPRDHGWWCAKLVEMSNHFSTPTGLYREKQR